MTSATESQVAYLRKLRLGTFVLGLILLAVSAVLLVRTYLFTSMAVATEATVTANESRRGDGSERFYSPTFSFTDQDGNEQIVEFQHESTYYSYSVGETVEIRYDPDNPQAVRVASFFGTWGAAVIVAALGLGAFLASFLFKYMANAFIEQQAQKRQIAHAQSTVRPH